MDRTPLIFSEPVYPGGQGLGELRAEAALRLRLTDAQQEAAARFARPGFPTCQEWFDRWMLDRYISPLWSEPGKRGSERKPPAHWATVSDRLGHLPMEQVLPSDLRGAFDKVRASHAPTYTYNIWQTLHAMFSDACRFGWQVDGHVVWRMKDCPMDTVPRPPRGRSEPKPVLTSDELRAVLAESEAHWASWAALNGELHPTTCMLALESVLGLRVGEALQLQWTSVRLSQPRGGLAGWLVWPEGARKWGVPLRLPLPERLLRFLPLHRRAPSGRVWEGSESWQRNVNQELRRAAEAVGLDPAGLTTHCLRHGVASAANADGSVRVAQEILGHTSARQTEEYLRSMQATSKVGTTLATRAAALLGEQT